MNDWKKKYERKTIRKKEKCVYKGKNQSEVETEGTGTNKRKKE